MVTYWKFGSSLKPYPKGPKYFYGTKYGFCSSNFPYGLGKYTPYGYLGPFGLSPKPEAVNRNWSVLEPRILALRVQVPNNYILTPNLYYNQYYLNPKYPVIGYMDP